MLENFEYKKSLGQNFINDQNIIDKIVKVAGVDKDTLVIEIGPGAGVLSSKIIPLSKYSILYEIDTRLEEILDYNLCKYDNYKIIFNDFLCEDVSLEVKKYDYKKLYVVANLPYYITTPIICKITEELNVDKVVIMIQKEVADRLCAKVNCKDYGYISAYLNYFYDIKKEFLVSRKCFTPSPKVDSMVISLNRIDRDNKVNNIELLNRILKDSFKYKRKNLKNNLKGYDLKKIESVLEKHKLNITCRAENVSIDVFVDIANELDK